MEIVLALLQYGTTPALIVLSAAVGFLAKSLKENQVKDEERHKALTDMLSKELEKINARIDAVTAEIAGDLQAIRLQIAQIERDYLPREEHYRDFSGWRAEIHRIMERLDRLMMEMKK